MGMTPSAPAAAPAPTPSIFGTTPSLGTSASAPSIFGTSPSTTGNMFGAPSGGSKPFTFSSSPSTTTAPAPQTSASGFSFSSSTAASSSATSAPSSTSKLFGDIVSKTTSGFTPSATPSFSSSPSSQPGTNDQLVDIYKKLRGLNVSLSDTVKKSIDEDAFADLSGIFEKYKTKRSEIQIELDKMKGKETKTSGSTTAASTASVPKVAPPPAPTTFAGFGGKPFTAPIPSVTAPSTTTTKALFPEFKPPSATSAPTFPEFKPPVTSNTSSSGFEFKPPALPSSSFGSKPLEAEKEKDKTATNGESAFTPPTNSFFGTSSNKPAFTFGTSNPTTSSFGSSSSTNFFAPPAGLGKPVGETAPAPTNFFSLTSKPVDGSSSTSSNIFGGSSFGKPSTTTTSSFFGSASASATSNSSSTPLFGSSKPPLQPAFSFGSSPAETKPATSESLAPAAATSSTVAEGSNSARSTPATDATAEGGEGGEEGALGLNTPNPHDLEGKGEEDEETVHSVKLKAYRLKKDETGANKWAELGLGFLRLKKHKETDNRRVLLRNSANGRILLNFRVYAGLSPTVMGTKKGLTFIGHDEGKATSYLVRLPNEEATTQLKAALDREIEFVKTKSSDS
ncbi:hypothetical protein BJ165DRAFT_984605 [Panaeolus papilionaceus]|nr:hypothetical protein BJ165DRAFT_984605 [Panaeolus papilionaceus]